MPAGFRRHLVGKTLRNVCYCDNHLNTLCWQVNARKDIFLNQWIEFYLNNMTNLRPLTGHIMSCYIHKMDHRHCGITSPHVYAIATMDDA